MYPLTIIPYILTIIPYEHRKIPDCSEENVKLLTVLTARLKSPVRLGLTLPTKTGSLTQTTPSNPNSSSTCTTPTNSRKALTHLTHLTKLDPAKQIRSLIWTYSQTSFYIMTGQRSCHKKTMHMNSPSQQSIHSHVNVAPINIDNIC